MPRQSSHRPVRISGGLLALVLPLALVSATGEPALAAPAGPAPVAQSPETASAAPVANRKRAKKKKITIRTMSTRNDMVSGGDVRIAIKPIKGVRNRKIRVFLNGRNVTKRFSKRHGGRFEAYLKNLDLGRNVLRVKAPRRHRGRLVITNHPNGGPLFSGPQFPYYQCQDSAVDEDCNEPPTYRYLYKSSNPLEAELKPYDRANPPSDVATTTTDQGVKVPFIVRREDGYQDRDRYTIITLWQPGKRWTRWKPQKQFNRKLLVTHGGNCGASYAPGSPRLADYSGTIPEGVPGVTPSYITALGRGFAVISTALNNTGHNCNVAMNAESVMMAKERFVEQYGTLRYTIGTGCSGGSIAQHTVANAYPGIYQGLTTQCSYPDTLTAGAQFADYHLMRIYFEDPSRWGPGVVWNPAQMAQVEGHITPLNAVVADEGLFKTALNPESACSGTKDPVAGDPTTRYDSEINPAGIRCSVLDLLIKNLGPRPKSAWGAEEKEAGRGFGGLPFANTGIMYGLNALKAGQITTAQFVDLNEKLGGLDVDSRQVPERTAGDPGAVRRAYRTGLVNETNNMDQVAMINAGGPDPGIAHDYAHAFWTEDRLQRAQGHTGNRVMWFGVTPLIGDLNWANESFIKMDKWLHAVERDRSRTPLARKIVKRRPADVTDRCSNVPGVGQTTGPDGEVKCIIPESAQLRLSTPREVAGDNRFNDRMVCQLKPLTRQEFDFLLLPMSEADFAKLQAVFPRGVCDYTKPGYGQRGAQTWLTYSSRSGGVAIGGRNLRQPAPFSAEGWGSRPFRGTIYQ